MGMAGTASEESGVGRSLEGISSAQQRCQSSEALAEWRSSEHVENGSPSTSPPYWDTDDDDDCGMCLFFRLWYAMYVCSVISASYVSKGKYFLKFLCVLSCRFFNKL